MIGRILWLAGIAAVAFVTAAVQLDRQARVTPGLSASVPEPFRAFAQANIVSDAMRGADNARALEEAQRLVARRPIPAEHLRVLAAAQFKAGNLEAGSRTIQIAAKRGWRDPLSQEAVLRLAIAAGDQPEAARRFAALFLSNETDDTLLRELAPPVFSEAEGPARNTLTEIVVGGERWFGFFLNRGPRVLPPDAFIEVVLESRKRGADFNCKGIGRARSILEKRDAAAAEQLAAEFAGQC